MRYGAVEMTAIIIIIIIKYHSVSDVTTHRGVSHGTCTRRLNYPETLLPRVPGGKPSYAQVDAKHRKTPAFTKSVSISG